MPFKNISFLYKRMDLKGELMSARFYGEEGGVGG